MRKQVTVFVCDVCGNEFVEEEVNAGKVTVNDEEELRFDICHEDTQKLFGEIEPSVRRGRKVAA